MANCLTGSPSSSSASGSFGKSLQPYLTGLLNPGASTYTLTRPSGGGGGGCGSVFNPLTPITDPGAIFNPTDPNNLLAPPGVGGPFSSSGSGKSESLRAFLAANPGLTSLGGGKYLSSTDITNLPKGWTEVQNPNRSQALGAFALDPTQIANESSSLAKFSDPNFTNPNTNPTVLASEEAIQTEENLNLQKNLAQLGSTFGLAGQTNLGGSSPFAQAGAEAVGQTQQTISDQIAEMLLKWQTDQEQLQQTGLQEESQFNMLPANLIAQLAPLLAKGKGATPSPLQSIGQILGSIGGAAGGLAALA